MEGALATVFDVPTSDGGPTTLSIRSGDVIQIAGANGSGKTSILRALAGLENPLGLRAELAVHCGFTMQRALDSLIGLTVAGEFRLRGQSTPDDLASRSEQDVATLSAGEARSVALATAQSHTLVLLDEPAEGLDAEAEDKLRQWILQQKTRGAVIIADPANHFSDLATARVELGSPRQPQLEPIPNPGGPAILQVPSQVHTVGNQSFTFPSLQLGPGFHVMTGPNGCGKTQFLGQLQSSNARSLPQNGRHLLSHATVDSELKSTDNTALQIVEAIARHRHPWSLSGGEQQRVALAKVLGQSAPAYLLDEPEAHLDGAGLQSFWQLVQRRVHEGACVLAATHDRTLIAAANSEINLEVA